MKRKGHSPNENGKESIMDRRKMFADTMNHVQPERMPVDFGGHPLCTMEGESYANLLQYLGIEADVETGKPRYFSDYWRIDNKLLEYFDIDFRAVGEIFHPKEGSHWKIISDTEYIDEWGIRRRYTGMYWDIIEAPLKDATLEELEAYRFPDPSAIEPERFMKHAHDAKHYYENTNYIVTADLPCYGIFELGCWICGFDDFLYRVLAEPEFVELFFRRVLEYQKGVSELYYKAVGPYIHYTSSGDDFSTQQGPFISPQLFHDLVEPYFAERIRFTKQFTKAKFLHHCCGSVVALIDHLSEAGVDILNPIQPKAAGMDPLSLKRGYGDRMVFHGGIDTQELLPFMDEVRIDESVHETIEIMKKDGGYIFAAAHCIQPDVQPEKLVAMYEAARKYR